MLDALLGLDLGINSGGCGSCESVSLAPDIVIRRCLPAAAAGSRAPDLAASVLGLPESLPIGLLLRLGSDFLVGGDRERRSNLDALFGSGSV